MASAFGGSSSGVSSKAFQGAVKQKAMENLNQWKRIDSELKADGAKVQVSHSAFELTQGQIEFSGLMGHRALYLIAPPELEDPGPILMHMFDPDSSKGWNLTPPNLTLFGLGGRDHYIQGVDFDQ
eukprot:4423379-Pyramimonas_sp.AAC.1